jgi:low temperature requirement protein LtrA
VFVQMTGALIVASGVEPLVIDQDLTIPVIGDVVMRVAGVAQWLRAAKSDPTHRRAATRYAVGVGLCQAAWVVVLFLPADWLVPLFITLAIIELLVPVWAEVASPTTWHNHHIKERYGLFTIIVLGETILSANVAIQAALRAEGMEAGWISPILGGLLIVFAMWWLYFHQPDRDLMSSLRTAFVWGYGHYLIFAATAAVGAGLAVVVDQITHHAEISAEGAGMAVAIPVAIYVFCLWLLQQHHRSDNVIDTALHLVTAVLILLTPFTSQAVLLTGVLLAALVVIRLVRHLD